MERVVILGSGLSGLISSYRIKESGNADTIAIYERNTSVSKRNSTAAFYCYKFLNEELTPGSFEVHWRIKTKLKTKEEFRKAYANKVYGENYQGKVSIKDGDTKGYEINTDALIEHADINYNMNCTNINTEKRIVQFNDEVKVEYDTLIVTLPMPLFMLISSRQKNKLIRGRGVHSVGSFSLGKTYSYLNESYLFKCEPIYYSVVNKIAGNSDWNHMNLEYYPDPDVPFYRKTTWGDKITIESMKEFDDAVAANPGKMWDCEGIPELRNQLKSRGVYFQGRYARWARKDLTHMVWNRVIKEIYE